MASEWAMQESHHMELKFGGLTKPVEEQRAAYLDRLRADVLEEAAAECDRSKADIAALLAKNIRALKVSELQCVHRRG